MNNIDFSQEFNEDCSKIELQALRDRVCLFSNDIIYFHQVMKPTVFSANLMYERCKELEKEINGPVAYLIDLRETSKIPSLKLRNIYSSHTNTKPDYVYHISVFLNESFMLDVIKFILRTFSLEGFSIHTSQEEAIAIIDLKRNQYNNKLNKTSK